MVEPSPRKLTILDGMILIAAFAVGFSLAKAERLAYWFVLLQRPDRWGLNILLGSSWIALTLGFALIILRLRQPRPPWPRLWRQPGWLACVAASLSAVLVVGQQIGAFCVLAIKPRHRTWEMFYEYSLIQIVTRLPGHPIFAVGSVWAVLALSRDWRGEPSAIDRMGQVIGVYWLIYPIVVFVEESFFD